MRLLSLAVALMLAFGSSLPAQDTSAVAAAPDTATPYRSPQTAAVFGTLLPGAGHLYAGEYTHAARYYFGTVSALGLGAIALPVSGMAPHNDLKWPMRVGAVFCIGVGVFTWARSAIDAPRAAVRANVRHEREAGHLSLVVRPREGPARGANLGLAVAW